MGKPPIVERLLPWTGLSRDIFAAVAAYFIGAGVIVLAGTLIGSFVFWEWWTPLSSIGGRGSVAWLALAPALSIFLIRRFA
jgi:hypothetical protein